MPSRGYRILFFFISAALLRAIAVHAQTGVEFSTISAPPVKEESPLILNVTKDSSDARVGLDYSIRWDFSDLAHLKPRLSTLAEGISAVRNWDITENTKVRYYGFATNPWRIFIAKEKVVNGAPSQSGTPAMTDGGEKPEYEKHLRLSFSPLVDDFKRNLDENLRTLLLQNSLRPVKTVGPQWQSVGTSGKKDFFNDVISLDIWGAPGLGSAKQGLQYISK